MHSCNIGHTNTILPHLIKIESKQPFSRHLPATGSVETEAVVAVIGAVVTGRFVDCGAADDLGAGAGAFVLAATHAVPTERPPFLVAAVHDLVFEILMSSKPKSDW